jgi:cytochrome c551/c552
MRPLALLVSIALLVPTMARARPAEVQEAAGEGAALFIRKGCLGCHGASGRGGVGPDLAHTALPLADFVAQLRSPRGIMPRFPEEVVSDEQARAVHAYLQSVAPRPPKLRAEVPAGVLGAETCAACHRTLHPTIVQQFEASAMGRPGVQNPRVVYPQDQLTCANCHGTDHDEIMASKGRVPESLCGACHPQIYKQHVLDAGTRTARAPATWGSTGSATSPCPTTSRCPAR